MTNDEFMVVWALSFLLYLVIYTWWIPYRTQRHIEKWLRSEDSDETLILSLGVIIKSIREQALVDFEEFMLPRARESFKNFWNGAMGNAVKEIVLASLYDFTDDTLDLLDSIIETILDPVGIDATKKALNSVRELIIEGETTPEGSPVKVTRDQFIDYALKLFNLDDDVIR